MRECCNHTLCTSSHRTRVCTPCRQVAYGAGDFVWLAEDRADRAVLIGSGACLFVDERDTREAHEKQANRRFSAQRRFAPGATLRGSIRLSATLRRNNAAALQRKIYAAALQRNNAAALQRSVATLTVSATPPALRRSLT